MALTPEQQDILKAHALAASQDPNNPSYNPSALIDSQFGGATTAPRVDPASVGAISLTGITPPDSNTPPADKFTKAAAPLVGNPLFQTHKPTQSAGAAVPGAVPVDSPEKKLLTGQNESSDMREAALQSDKQTAEEQKSLLQKGFDLGQQQKQIGEAIDQGNAAQIKMAEQKAQYAADQRARDLEAASAEQRAKKEDPNHWFKERGVAGSLLAAISIGAGAFAAAMPHTASHENFALKIIDDSIGRDVSAQRENIEKGWKELNFQGTQAEKADAKDQYVLAQMRDARQKDLLHARAMADDALTKANNQAAIVGLNNVKSGIDKQLAGLHDERTNHMVSYLTTERARAAAAAAQGQVSEKEIIAEAQKIMHDEHWQPPVGMTREQGARDAANKLLTGRGQGGGSFTGGKGAEHAERLASFEAADTALQDLINQRAKNGGGILSPSQTATMAGTALSVRMSLDHALAGRVSDTTLKELQRLIPEDPNAWSATGALDAQLKNAQKEVRRQKDALLQESGRPVQPRLPTEPVGKK